MSTNCGQKTNAEREEVAVCVTTLAENRSCLSVRGLFEFVENPKSSWMRKPNICALLYIKFDFLIRAGVSTRTIFRKWSCAKCRGSPTVWCGCPSSWRDAPGASPHRRRNSSGCSRRAFLPRQPQRRTLWLGPWSQRRLSLSMLGPRIQRSWSSRLHWQLLAFVLRLCLIFCALTAFRFLPTGCSDFDSLVAVSVWVLAVQKECTLVWICWGIVKEMNAGNGRICAEQPQKFHHSYDLISFWKSLSI